MGVALAASGTRALAEADRNDSAPSPTVRRIVVLCSDNRLHPANVLFDASLRAALASSPGRPVECYTEFLDERRFPVRHQERMLAILLDKYSEPPPDVLVAFARPSLDFCVRHRPQLFAAVPIVFAGLGTETPGDDSLGPLVTGVRWSFDAAATLRLAMDLHPRTRQVFVLDGPSGTDATSLGWSQLSQAGFQLPIHHLADSPLPRLLQQVAGLPPNSLVIDLSGLGASLGTEISPQETMQRLSEASRAPIYAVADPLLGHGLVGALTTPTEAVGRATASLVEHVLARPDPQRLPAVQTLAARPLFDWRAMRRWSLRKSQLPSGSLVRFEPPSFWRQHFLLVVTSSSLFVLQSGLIIALVLQSRRRRRAELDAQRRREELTHMTRVATMGELTASLAHEINQPLAAILSNAQAAQRLLDAGGVDAAEMKDILADIASDDQRAGEVIRRMRALLRKGESSPSDVDVNEMVGEVVGLVRGEMILQDVSLVLELDSEPQLVHGDRVQLQQVLLNLMVNALDAMKEASGGNRRLVVRTEAAEPRSVRVSVQDGGVGVPSDRLEQVFEPFVTTKPHGMGLGLAICRSIIQAHGGRIGSTNNADRGATFWFTLPALEEAKP